MKSVGIDIGTASIKVVEVNANSKGVQVSRFTEHPLNPNPAFDPEIEILEFLRGLISTYDQATTRFVVGLRQEHVSVRLKPFPFNDRQKILKSLPFELEEDLPFTQETAIYDAKIVRYLGSTAEVLACASPKVRISETLEQMQDAGIEVSLLSVEGIAFANCIERWDSPVPSQAPPTVDLDQVAVERKISIVVNMGHTRTLVCAFENNLLIGVRSVLWGGKNIAESIARRYEIPLIEAIKEMETKAFILASKDGASYDQIVFSDTICNQVKDLARELKISILEFRSEFNGVVESVGITGGASQILNVHAYLTQSLELPVNKYFALANFSNVAFDKTGRIDSVIGVALGLAVEGLKKPRNPSINFLRGEFALDNAFFQNFWAKWKVTTQVTAGFFVVFLAYSMTREVLSLSLSERTTESVKEQAKSVAKLPTKAANESGVKKYIREQKKRSTELKTFESLAKMNSALDILKKVNDAVPGKSIVGIDVHKFLIQEDEVTFEGVVSNAQQFATLEATLASVASGKVNRKTNTMTSKKPGVAFAFSFKVDRGMNAKK